MKCNHILLRVWITALLVVPGGTLAAEITVLSDGPLAPALKPIAERFHSDSGHYVKFVFGLSPAIHKMVTEGQAADVVIVQPNFIDELVKAGKVATGEHPVIARVGIGLFTRADAKAPDISTAQTLKQALLSADTIALSNVAAGNYFATVLERIGIADAVKGKVTRTSPADVVTHVLQGKGNDLGIGTLTLIIADRRLKLVGALPSELQINLVYAAAPTANSPSPEAAKEFIHFLTLPQAKKEFAAAGAD